MAGIQDLNHIEILSTHADIITTTMEQIHTPFSEMKRRATDERMARERKRKRVSKIVVTISLILVSIMFVLIILFLKISASTPSESDSVRNSNEMLRKQTPVPPKPAEIPYSPTLNVTTVPP
ncbi:hypothetical protein ScPMuIL_013007 [Solemya velum]